MTRKRFLAILAALFLVVSAPQVFADRGGGSGSGGSGRGGSGGSDDDGNRGGGGGGGDKELVLRVNSAVGVPGGIVAVVLRTYAPRPVRQGQVLVRVVRRPRPGKLGLTVEELTQPVRPFLTLVSAVVYSQRNDALSQAILAGQPDSQMTKVEFQSPSGTINASDGPLAVLRFRLDPSVQPGQTFDLAIDPVQTALTDGQGRPITVKPRNGVLTVRTRRRSG